ncbi:Uncharacterized membrane protein HdeD, DUF308 family [Halogranum amylolyticum]|uniref:Uncharacterized membrane protein HdeD, DUF308 family n=1 Tax=Halogranum amylolyticum TaxID=660520 RepID=A0A1H8USD2_9EURY|nr:HdeD family acid-resistance protein [Halogranum amylolyticum]SEP06102.1 Uncharacterized membrane protein HdeD, DUF308 family [Halogranum amylolyticum]
MASTTDYSEPDTSDELSNTLRDNWRPLLYAGVLLAATGLIAILAPFLTGISITMLVGVLLVVGGLFHFVGAFKGQGWAGFAWQIALGVIGVVAGAIVLLNPIVGLLTLTLAVIGYLVASGVVEIVMGLRLRGEKNWLWSVLSGVLGIVLGAMLWAGFPSTALWTVGLLFGINLLTTGVSMVAVALGGRSLAETEDSSQFAGAGGV